MPLRSAGRHTVSATVLGLLLLGQLGAQEPVPSRIRGTVDLTVGTEAGAGASHVVGIVGALTFDTRGRILVADLSDNTIQVFSAWGAHEFSFGRTGRGPGDLLGPCCLAVRGGDTLWIKEARNRRFSVFHLTDESAIFIRTFPGRPNPFGAPERVDFDAQGQLFDFETSMELRVVRLVVGRDGTIVQRDTVRSPPADSLDDVIVTTPNGIVKYGRPFGARDLHAFGAGGESAYAVSSNYSVLWRDARGGTKALLRRTLAPISLSERERRTADSSIERMAQAARTPRSRLGVTVPGFKPAIAAMGFDLDGRLWVERSVPDGKAREADVYDRQARWIAIASWPSNVTLHSWAIREWTALGVAVDDSGAQSVVRLRFQ
jgi:hypothetical protein